MLVLGTHFYEDLAGNHDSWKWALEAEGISLSVEHRGIGYEKGIVDIFCKHIRDAVEVIKERG